MYLMIVKLVTVSLFALLTTCSQSSDLRADSVNGFRGQKDIGKGVLATRDPLRGPEQQVTKVYQLFYDIVADGGASCNGDVVTAVLSTTIAKGSRLLNVSRDTFKSGDIGKVITVPGAGPNGGMLRATIKSIADPQHITLSDSAGTALYAVSEKITYGTDDAPRFLAFNTWARAKQGNANQVVLTIPSGASCWFGTASSISGTTLKNAWRAGINDLIVEGTGATLNSVGGAGFSLGGQGIIQIGLNATTGQSARIRSVSAGASQVVLTSASFSAGFISRFSVGRWIMIGGLDIQGLWVSAFGFPPNLHYFEWRQITAVNTNTGAITLDRPLTNSYLETWPEYNAGSNFEVDSGGPATIYALNDTWNGIAEYRGLTISQSGQTYAGMRSVTFRNVIFTGGGDGGIPSQNETFTCINCDYTGLTIEVDKLIGTLTYDGLTVSQLKTQSSSVDTMVVKNARVTNGLTGGAKRTEITDATIASWIPGAYAYGASSSSICTRCVVAKFSGFGSFDQGGVPQGVFTMKDGIIKFPNTAANGIYLAQRAFVPLTGNVFYRVGSGGSGDTIGLFRVRSIAQDPWPSLTDNQTAITNVTMSPCTPAPQLLTVSTSIFSSGDVGKVIYIPGARNGGAGTLRTFISGFTNAKTVTVGDGCTDSQASVPQTLQWGTSNVDIQTSEAGGFPAWTSALQGFRPHPSPQYTCDTCSGNIPLSSTSVENGAKPLMPLGSYVSFPFAPTATGAIGMLPAYGRIISATINVTQAYSGFGSAQLNVTSQFGLPTVKQSDGSSWSWFPRVNLKQTGIRVITPGGVTCNGSPGACSGDTINSIDGFPPEAVWIKGGIQPYMNNTIGAGTPPLVTVTVQTDQGVVP